MRERVFLTYRRAGAKRQRKERFGCLIEKNTGKLQNILTAVVTLDCRIMDDFVFFYAVFNFLSFCSNETTLTYYFKMFKYPRQ